MKHCRRDMHFLLTLLSLIMSTIIQQLIYIIFSCFFSVMKWQCFDTNKKSDDYLANNHAVYGNGLEDMATVDDQGDMSFCMSNYARETMKMLFMMRSHHMLTDVVLEVQQELFHAHKVILSAASPYFKAMFTGGLKECEMSRVKLQGVSDFYDRFFFYSS